jgi:hypothetical protein
MNLITKNIQWKLLFFFLGAIAFSLFCWHYAKQITLWGDEAFSLLYYDRNFLSSVEGDVHLPTYYWILKQILTLFNEPSELVLRMFHVIPFIIGLLFGIFVIQRIFKNFSLIYLVLTITITLPNFIFYATNLRMYSLLFMMEMIFIDAISRILTNKKATSNYQLLWLLSSGFALLFVDYSSIISISPLIFLAIISIKSIKAIISWDIQASSGIQGMSFLELAKWLYLACRPVFDLIYPASLPTVIVSLDYYYQVSFLSLQ